MRKRAVPITFLVVYSIILVIVMVFKDVPMIRVGQIMLNFGGTEVGAHPANFIPFATIIPYLVGEKGLLIGAINIIGNIILLVPLGFLAMFVWRTMSWKKALLWGLVSGLTIELLQTILRLGIFDIDDVILNALGFMIGFWAFILLVRWLGERKYVHILGTAIIIIIAAIGSFYAIFPPGQHPTAQINSETNAQSMQDDDPCGGTGGAGRITATSSSSVTLVQKRNEKKLVVHFSDRTTVKTAAGFASTSDLRIGQSVTIVGDPTSEGNFDANEIFVCNPAGTATSTSK
ncbi:MAG TPA: VanZ family protein [Candidatus Paceibacterota bacterium]